MSDNGRNRIERETIRGIFWFALVFMLGSGWLVWEALTGAREGWSVPLWIGAAFGLSFFSASLAVGMMDKMFNSLRDKVWFSSIQLAAIASIPLLLLVMFNWVAFGPGEREFSVSVSIPFIGAYFPNANQILGRAVFGIFAILGDLFVGGVVFSMIRGWINGDDGEWRW
jgi:hypothetical protein